MPRPSPDTPRYEKLRASRKSLGWIAPLIRFSLFSIGFSLFLDQIKTFATDGHYTWGEQQIMTIVGLSYLGGFGLAAWIVGRLISTGADLIDVFIDQAEAAARTTELIEQHGLPTLARIALALEKLENQTKTVEPVEDELTRRIEVARQAIKASRWAQAEKLIQAIIREKPGPDAAKLLSELEDARNLAVDGLMGRLEAAKNRSDALLVVELRDALTEHLRGERLTDLDKQLIGWLIREIKQKIVAGPIKPEVASLASRVADSFADTPEGASLKTSLPNIRRRAGLCPRCARPFRGPADACPRCLGSGATSKYDPIIDDAD